MKKYVIAYMMDEKETKLFFFFTSKLPKYLEAFIGKTIYPWIDFDELLYDQSDKLFPEEAISFLNRVGMSELNQSEITLCEVPTSIECKVI